MTDTPNETATLVGCVTINVRRIYEVYDLGLAMAALEETANGR